MAAVCFSSDHSLEERIYQMQKLDLDACTRELLEEAGQLYSGGRHIEASALVEKAEAMISAVSVNVPQIATASTYRDGASKTDAAPSEEPLAARIVTNVANGLTKVLVGLSVDKTSSSCEIRSLQCALAACEKPRLRPC